MTDASGAPRFFAQSYAEARDKFFAAARSRGLGVETHVHPLAGRDGEMLAMDVARDGPADAKALLVVSSACHGVEGFCGSGVQGALLADSAWQAVAQAAGVAVLYIHALNPYGFSWWRRTTHENVDLNRNFRDFASRGAGQRRLRLARRADRPRDLARRRGQRRRDRPVRRQPRRARAAAGALGRAVPPSGRPLLRRQRSRPGATRRCARCCASTATRCQRLAWIDLHTGLGPNGHGERIFACRDDAAAFARAKAWWGDVTSIYDGSSTLGAC